MCRAARKPGGRGGSDRRDVEGCGRHLASARSTWTPYRTEAANDCWLLFSDSLRVALLCVGTTQTRGFGPSKQEPPADSSNRPDPSQTSVESLKPKAQSNSRIGGRIASSLHSSRSSKSSRGRRASICMHSEGSKRSRLRTTSLDDTNSIGKPGVIFAQAAR